MGGPDGGGHALGDGRRITGGRGLGRGARAPGPGRGAESSLLVHVRCGHRTGRVLAGKLAPDFLRRAAPRGLLRRLSISGPRQRCRSHDSVRPARSRVDLLGRGSPETAAHVRPDSARDAGQAGRRPGSSKQIEPGAATPCRIHSRCRRWRMSWPLSAVAALYFVMGEYTQSLELRPFDVLYGVAFSVVVLLLVLTCTRMVSDLDQASVAASLRPTPRTFRWWTTGDRYIADRTRSERSAALIDSWVCATRSFDRSWRYRHSRTRLARERSTIQGRSELFALPYVSSSR